MITELGRYLRKIRFDNKEILKEMANKLDVSSAFLSAVENGKKKMPDNWFEKLTILYKLTPTQQEELKNANIASSEIIELNINNVLPANKQLAISFARNFETMDEELCKKLMELLNLD